MNVSPTATHDREQARHPETATTGLSPTTATGYWFAGAVAGIGVTIALMWGAAAIFGLIDRVSDAPRITPDAEAQVEISEPGERLVYYEGPEAGRLGTELPALDINVNGPDGGDLAVDTVNSILHYRLFDRRGEAVARFHADAPGAYQLTVTGDAPPDAAVIVADDTVGTALMHAAGAAILVVLSSTAALVVATRTAVRRDRASR